MTVQLADGTAVVSQSVAKVPVLFTHAVQHVIECRVVDKLSYPLVLGMDWLQQHNPVIDWVGYTVTLGKQ